MNDKDITIRWTKGQGPGGQHKNKVANCCVMSHTPSGITVTVDGRSREQNLKKAKRLLAIKIRFAALRNRQIADKDARLERLRDGVPIVRTYNFKKDEVLDHRTGKSSSIKNVLRKGRIEDMYDQ